MMDEISKYWRNYQRALLPKTSPHMPPRTELLSPWKLLVRGLLFARWEENFDCGYETEWYHVIKDDKFDISKLNSNRRYKITKAKRFFYTEVIDPNKYLEDIFNIAVEAYKEYPVKYRPKIIKKDFIDGLKNRDSNTNIFIGCFDKNTNSLVGYAHMSCYKDHINYSTHKVLPREEKRQVNAALVLGAIEYFEANTRYRYIDDGSRNIVHETGFQDYLIIYFGFRKAYSNLHVMYNPVMKILVNLLFPFKEKLEKHKSIVFISKINSIMLLEKIRRSFL